MNGFRANTTGNNRKRKQSIEEEVGCKRVREMRNYRRGWLPNNVG